MNREEAARTRIWAETFAWLRGRNPGWSDDRIERQIAATHVIDEHPDWGPLDIEQEVNRRLNTEETEEQKHAR